jgi:methionyl-tRNA formyltransferase
MLKVLHATAEPIPAGAGAAVPGAVLEVGKNGLLVRTADGALRITRIQPEGCKAMDVQAWLCGHAIPQGLVFITPPAPTAQPIAAYRRL